MRLVCFGQLDDALEFFGSFGPDERLAVLVVFGKVGLEEAFQFFAGFVDRLLQTLPGQNAEEAFDQVRPRGVRWSGMEGHHWMLREPRPRRLILMGVSVVQDNTKTLLGIRRYDLVHEAEEVGGGAGLFDLCKNLAGLDLQAG